ncbi:MAG: hypothetical protein PIR53_13365 [Nocardioides alkalitolerans]
MPSTLLPLRGVRCRRCDLVATPVQSFGCEACGAHGPDLEETDLTGDGVVLNAVDVHRRDAATVHIGSVHLAEGPMLRALLDGAIPAGTPVAATDVDGVLVFAAGGGSGR